MKNSKQLLSLAMFMMMTGCASHFAIIKEIGDKSLLIEDVDTKSEKIFLFDNPEDRTDFLELSAKGDSVLIKTRHYEKNILSTKDRDRIYFNADSICTRAERIRFNTLKQEIQNKSR